MARPPLLFRVSAKDQKDLKKLLGGGVQQVRVVLRAVVLLQLTQGLSAPRVSRSDGTTRRSATPFRYVWPAELDLMARIAGMSLENRWADWMRSEFTSDSRSHVSVWRKPA